MRRSRVRSPSAPPIPHSPAAPQDVCWSPAIPSGFGGLFSPAGTSTRIQGKTMSTCTRRPALPSAAALSVSPLLFAPRAAAAGTRALQADPPISAARAKALRPLVHVTDLFRPHDDPDDHWDLATVYALARRGIHEIGRAHV